MDYTFVGEVMTPRGFRRQVVENVGHVATYERRAYISLACNDFDKGVTVYCHTAAQRPTPDIRVVVWTVDGGVTVYIDPPAYIDEAIASWRNDPHVVSQSITQFFI